MTNREIKEIAELIINDGTINTSNGNWVVYYDELPECYDVSEVKENVMEIIAELGRHDEVADVGADADCIDVMFYTGYCPNVEDEYEEEESEMNEAKLYVGVRPSTNDHIVKRPTEFDGIEQYLYERLDKNPSIKVNEAGLQHEGMTVAEAWEIARRNTFAETKIESLAKMMARLSGMEMPDVGGPDIYVVTTETGFRGAAAVLDRKAIKALSDRLGVNTFIMLPSSIHEVLLVPYDDGDDISNYTDMVGAVNGGYVDEAEQLGNRAYIMNV